MFSYEMHSVITDSASLTESEQLLPAHPKTLFECSPFCLCVHQAIRSVLWQDVYPQIKLWEFYQVNVDSVVEHFRTLLQNGLYLRSVNSSEAV